MFTANIVIALVVIVVLFLAFRAIVTWYWKIDDIKDLLEKIEINTRKDNTPKDIL